MALNAYLKLAGEKQGEIKGSTTLRGREGLIMVIAYNHDVTIPIDVVSGLPSGKRKHTPLVILKEIDKSSPSLMTMLIKNENIKQWELRFWQPSFSGTEVQHFTIQLQNASIVDIRQEMLNNKYPENSQHREREFVSFRYQKISWTWEETRQTCEDSW